MSVSVQPPIQTETVITEVNSESVTMIISVIVLVILIPGHQTCMVIMTNN